jgi:alginate O-acetyltransferase complex protein AlgJ
MATPEQPLPTGGISREEVARRELGHTAVDPGTARLLVSLFLLAIAAVSIVELVAARVGPTEGAATAWSHLRGLPAAARASWQTPVRASIEEGLTPWNRLVAANRAVLEGLEGFELALEDQSTLGRWLRPPAQLVLTRVLGAGNERVYPGRDGWLFFRPDVEHITGSGFLDPAHLSRRVEAAPEWEAPPQPDPRPAIVGFAGDLRSRGITLIVMPTPVKPAVHPDRLAGRYAASTSVLRNPSFDEFLAGLGQDGVAVFDPSAALEAASGAAAYLASDTHWRPEAMEAIAARLGQSIAQHVALPLVEDPGYRVERVEVRGEGDIARMLDLPADSALFPPEPVWLRRILQRDGSPWRPSRDAAVLLLGDSFTNIYALESMGWGTSAGLAEQLSYSLGRPIDRLVQNDEGAFATRALLLRDVQRLEGKRVVIYQFAVRELSFGDWRVLPLQ